jgi:hypothetical protein
MEGNIMENNRKPSEGLEFVLNEDGQSYTLDYIGDCEDERIVIPDTYNGKPVTSIDSQALDEGYFIKSIWIPASVTNIGHMALYECHDNLRTIEVDPLNPVYHSQDNCLIKTADKTLIEACSTSKIPKDGSVTTIAAGAFGSASKPRITIPKEIGQIEASAFELNSNLTYLKLPRGVQMGPRICAECDNLETAVIDSDVSEEAFAGCTSLYDIHIGSNVKSCGADAFRDMSYDAWVAIKDLGAWCQISFANIAAHPCHNGATLAFNDEEPITDVEIPKTVTSIKDIAFYGCKDIEAVYIPESVTEIGVGAFANCYSLTNIVIPHTVNSIGEDAFLNCNNLTNIFYDGTPEQFYALTQHLRLPAYATVHFTDGACTVGELEAEFDRTENAK